MTSAPASRAGGSIPWLVISGVLVAALSLRGPIVAPTPVLRDIETDLGVGSATVALLTAAPVLMFAVLTPVAAFAIRRAGAEAALMISLVGVLMGTFTRALPGFAWMLTGTVLIGASITIGNVVIPVVIRRDVAAHRVGIVTASYVAMLNVGSLVTSLFTAPLAEAVGWPAALLLWSVITLAGALLWGAHLARSRRNGGRDGDVIAPASGPLGLDPRTLTGPLPVAALGRARSFLRRPIGWLLMVTFACQAFIYYGLTTWLPVLSTDVLGLDRSSAGALASLFQGAAVIGAFVVPVLTRFAPPWVPILVIAASWLVLTIGAATAPQWMPLWLSVGAIAHAGGFVVVFTVLVGAARSDGEAAGMSALVQGGGYAVAAVAGPLLGGLREATGAWDAALALLVAVAVLYGVLLSTAFVAARSRRP